MTQNSPETDPAALTMSNKNKGDGKKGSGGWIADEDRRLWEYVVKTVTPIAGRRQKRPAADEAPPKQPAKRPSWRSGALEIHLKSAEISLSDNEARQKILPQAPDRLRRGKMPVEAVLDLHGLHQNAAQERLFSFLRQSSALGRRCVLVITGKGSGNAPGEPGVLRRMLPHWLEMDPVAGLVLSFSPARPKDGGGGAFYILLRRQRPDR